MLGMASLACACRRTSLFCRDTSRRGVSAKGEVLLEGVGTLYDMFAGIDRPAGYIVDVSYNLNGKRTTC
jgi:hypothetical protein